MKTRSVLALLMFILAVGSATATHLFTDPDGYSRKNPDVPIQVENCHVRATCSNGSTPCTAMVDHDGNPATGLKKVTLYTGITTPELICGQQLFIP